VHFVRAILIRLDYYIETPWLLTCHVIESVAYNWRSSVHGKSNLGHHRLNDSSSPVLTATSLSYGKSKNSTPHRIKTPDPIEIKFGTVDYVGKGTRHAKFYANSSKGGFSANGWNILKNFCFYMPFFSSAHPQVRPFKGFLRLIRQTTRFCTRKCLLGLEN